MSYECPGPRGLVWQEGPLPAPLVGTRIVTWADESRAMSELTCWTAVGTIDASGPTERPAIWAFRGSNGWLRGQPSPAPWAWLDHPDDCPPGHEHLREPDQVADTFVVLHHLGVTGIVVPADWEAPEDLRLRQGIEVIRTGQVAELKGLNGAQVRAVLQIAQSAADGGITEAMARQMLMEFFHLSDAQARALLSEVARADSLPEGANACDVCGEWDLVGSGHEEGQPCPNNFEDTLDSPEAPRCDELQLSFATGRGSDRGLRCVLPAGHSEMLCETRGGPIYPRCAATGELTALDRLRRCGLRAGHVGEHTCG